MCGKPVYSDLRVNQFDNERLTVVIYGGKAWVGRYDESNCGMVADAEFDTLEEAEDALHSAHVAKQQLDRIFAGLSVERH